jgi:hypothetical protein
MENPTAKRFDELSPIGGRIRFEILLDWDLTIPQGVVKRIVPVDLSHRQVYYLIELDSDVEFEPHRIGLLFRRRPKVSARWLILAMRHPDDLEPEFHGKVTGEFSAPLPYYSMREKDLPEETIGTVGDLEALGPVRVHMA